MVKVEVVVKAQEKAALVLACAVVSAITGAGDAVLLFFGFFFCRILPLDEEPFTGDAGLADDCFVAALLLATCAVLLGGPLASSDTMALRAAQKWPIGSGKPRGCVGAPTVSTPKHKVLDGRTA